MFLFSITNKIWVYEISKSLHHILFTFYTTYKPLHNWSCSRKFTCVKYSFTFFFQIDITPGPDGRFGFTIVGDSPLMVEECMPGGPAAHSGLKVGAYVMEVNGIPVKHHETAAAMIKAAQGRPLRLGVLSMARRNKRLSSSMRVLSQSGDSVRESRAHKAMEFNKKVGLNLFTALRIILVALFNDVN